MTVTRTYYCNLCGANGNGEPLRGLYWEQHVTREALIERPPRTTEHHICNKCLDDLRLFGSGGELTVGKTAKADK